MKSVGLYQYLPISHPNSLQDLELAQPTASGHDLLVEVKAISVNPVDTKVRAPKNRTETMPKILGWDATGVVVAIGEKVTAFHPGDPVWYAGDITRPGSNSEFQLVDERIVGRKPQNLDFAAAAALPLTTITAWEALFERLKIGRNSEDMGKSILIIGGAGGVGSIAIQLAKKLAKLTVIATASRPATIAWCQKMGADCVVNHHQNLAREVTKVGYEQVDYILCLNSTDHHWPAMTEAIKPQGIICTIVGNRDPLDMNELKNKSAGLVWEFMFTRSKYQTADMVKQRELLNEVSQLIDSGVLVTTSNDIVRPINAANLRSVHARIEQGNTIGKIVLADWN
ncbi:zinc-binding alcohol dehydrogenase family protein [filamentous cyanobacterium LEGE 11480]|uniref:Zinc-type alcohol dehydrogenase-like protein n=1 Tax=Romeriopsis navalis LEGE 11480 TaxID=2777977 RepID=A0A928Z6L4_9CYAN|nr:zinc-binding alcohol dehydrogenase family protein [Romeriopsis navalis]MBE9033137.1 zinc-binding alcohol dehydrogenase family protein [Romeriopsis navalis LEGE 11480]